VVEAVDEPVRSNGHGALCSCRRFIQERNKTGGGTSTLAPVNINVTCPTSGIVTTLFKQPVIDAPQLLEEQVQSIRWTWAGEVGRLAVMLASSDADYATVSSDTTDDGLAGKLGSGAKPWAR
jgi:hypothetical protein